MNVWALSIVFGFIVLPILILVLILIRILMGVNYEIETVNIKKDHNVHTFEKVKQVKLEDNLFKDSYVWFKRPYHYFIRGIRKKYLKVLVNGEVLKYEISKAHPTVCYIAHYSNAITKSFEADFRDKSNINIKQLLLFAFILIIVLLIYSWYTGGKPQ